MVRYENYMANPDRLMERLGGFLQLPLRAKADNTNLHDAGGNWSSFVPYVGKEQLAAHIEQLSGPLREEAEKFVKSARTYWNDERPKEDTRWHRSVTAEQANAVLSTPGIADTATLLGYNVADIARRAVQDAPAKKQG